MTNVLLGCAASAALHKACDLASKLTQKGHRVRTILTPNAAKLIAPQHFEALTGEPASSDEFDSAQRRTAMDHVDLGQWAELVLLAPASADLIGRIANGIASDLISTAVLVVPQDIPRLLAPAMNPTMLANPAVQRNLKRCLDDGWQLVDPTVGHMACGDAGAGRLAEPLDIVAAVERTLAGS